MLNAQEIRNLQQRLKKQDDRLPIIFNVLGEPRRCKIFRSFLKRDRLCVSDIAKLLGISMSLASQHLKVLELTGLLRRERQGRTVYFSPNRSDELVNTIIMSLA